MKQLNQTIYDQKAFAEWLFGEPSDTQYSYNDNGDCIFARWLKHLGVATFQWGSEEGVGGDYFRLNRSDYYNFPEWFSEEDFSEYVSRCSVYSDLHYYILRHWDCVKGEAE